MVRHADVPVNQHTGLPQIAVPLYTLTEGPIQVPVGLQYHAQGVRVSEPAGWTGTGWSINSGVGVITRTVMGAPDERFTSSNNAEQAKGYLSDRGYPGYLWQQDSVTTATTFLKDIYQGYADGEPDLFFFSAGGYSGKFYFGDDRLPVLLPQQDIRIQYTYTPGLRKSIESFILTTPDGTQYYFGVTASGTDTDPVERSLYFNAAQGYGHEGRSISAWYLNRIAAPDGIHSVTFTYAPEKYSYFTTTSAALPYTDASGDNGSRLNKVIVEGVRLVSITGSSGSIQLVPGALRSDLSDGLYNLTDNPNTEARSLGAVVCSSNNGNCRKFVLGYDYFTDPGNNGAVSGASAIQSDRKRLRLLQVQEQSCDGSIVLPPYTFTYYPEPVPRLLSFGQDHWGFSNGADNTTLIPTYTQNQFEPIPGADRDSHWPAMRGGALHKINLPTGGSTILDMEPNRFWVSYNRYTPTYRFSTAVGYDNNNTQTSNQTLSGNPYRIVLTNAACAYPATSCGASVQVFNSSNTMVFSLYVEGGQQQTGYATLPAGTYQVVMSRNAAGMGQVASAEFTEMVPGLYENNEIVGGLRIRQITRREGADTATAVVTQYDYTVNGRSSAVLYSRPVYVQNLKNSGKRYTWQMLYAAGASLYLDTETPPTPGQEPYFDLGARRALKSAAPLLPLRTTQGSPVGYREVRVSQPGNGYSLYRYYNSPNWQDDHSDVALRKIDRSTPYPEAPEYPAPPEPFDPRRGELQYEGHFTQSGKLVKETEYIPNWQILPVTTPGTRVYAYPLTGGLQGWIAAKTDFDYTTQKKISDAIIERQYDTLTQQSLTLQKTLYYESDRHSQPTASTTTNAKGQVLTTRTRYSMDYLPAGCTVANTCWTDYQATLTTLYNNYITTNAACTTAVCRDIANANYRTSTMAARRQYSWCRTAQAAAGEACLQTAVTAADSLLQPVLRLQQQHRLLPVEQTQWKGNKLLSATLTQYAGEPDDPLRLHPRAAWQLPVSAPITNFTAATLSGHTLYKDSRYRRDVLFGYARGVLQEMVSNNTGVSSFLWDYGYTRPVAQVVNARVEDIAYSSFETPQTQGWSYAPAGVLAHGEAATGKNLYQLSAGAIQRTILPQTRYTVSCWARGSVWVNGQPPTLTRTLSTGWVYCEWTVQNATQVSLTGQQWVDEVRLYPTGALLTTSTYDPAIGADMTSQCDARGNIRYFDYDVLGRLKQIRDENRRVIQVMDYRFSVLPTH